MEDFLVYRQQHLFLFQRGIDVKVLPPSNARGV